MKNILSATNYSYPKPINFDGQNPSFDLFKDFPDENCSEPKIEFLKNVRISTNSVVFNYFKIFRESCITGQNYEKYKKGYNFFLKFIFPKFNFSKKRFLLITDEWTSNYYHWHAFALKKLLVLKEKNLLENSLLFLPKKYQSYPFALASLEKFGVTKNQIVFLRRKSNIKVAELPLISIPSQHPELYKKIGETLTTKTKNSDLGFGNKIFISREKQVLRFIENADEVWSLLNQYGFKKIIAEEFSYDEQIAIFSEAKYLVAPHGAGLTNVIFMKKDSFVLEMTTPQIRPKFNKEFYALSSMVGLKYLYQKCEIGASSKVKDFHFGSLLVDVKELEKNLNLMLNYEFTNNPK